MGLPNQPLHPDALPFGRLWYTKPEDAIGYAKFFSRSHGAVIRVYDADGNVIEMHQNARYAGNVTEMRGAQAISKIVISLFLWPPGETRR